MQHIWRSSLSASIKMCSFSGLNSEGFIITWSHMQANFQFNLSQTVRQQCSDLDQPGSCFRVKLKGIDCQLLSLGFDHNAQGSHPSPNFSTSHAVAHYHNPQHKNDAVIVAINEINVVFFQDVAYNSKIVLEDLHSLIHIMGNTEESNTLSNIKMSH